MLSSTFVRKSYRDDHFNLSRCMHITPRPSGKLASSSSIQEIDLVIRHRTGKKNANADALSYNLVATLCAVSVPEVA